MSNLGLLVTLYYSWMKFHLRVTGSLTGIVGQNSSIALLVFWA